MNKQFIMNINHKLFMIFDYFGGLIIWTYHNNDNLDILEFFPDSRLLLY